MLLILVLMWIFPSLALGVSPKAAHANDSGTRSRSQATKNAGLRHLEARCVSVGETPDERVSPSPAIATGAPPLLSFRYYEGAAHHRYSHAGLMLDDAG
ncbi:MAG: hypothetical protein ACRD4O_08440, partial [Bryobacteraceae bacterium]